MRPEDRLQVQVARYLRDALPPGAWWSAVEHARKQSPMSGALQKSKGVRAGFPDISIWWNGAYYGVELKVKTAASEAQLAFRLGLVAAGASWVLVRSVVALDELLRSWGIPVAESMRAAAMAADSRLATEPKRSTSTVRLQVKPSAAAIRRTAKLRQKVMF